MKSRNLLRSATVAFVAIAAAGSAAGAQIRVVATTPDLASVAREIGGDKVSVVALAKPTEDPHYVDAKPSHIV
ncbi:MAG: metal ABC transporter solute-binding protein, Zn/Mn family, partial [Gemmatimonadaceae bacterium]